MRVKELMALLEQYNPDGEVSFFAHPDIDCDVEGVGEIDNDHEENPDPPTFVRVFCYGGCPRCWPKKEYPEDWKPHGQQPPGMSNMRHAMRLLAKYKESKP